jgi:hypothetical protein
MNLWEMTAGVAVTDHVLEIYEAIIDGLPRRCVRPY